MRRRSLTGVRARLSAAAAAVQTASTPTSPPAGQEAQEPLPTPFLGQLLHRRAPSWHDPTGPVTSALFARLTDEDKARIEGRLEGGALQIWTEAEDAARDRLTLIFAAYYEDSEALARTGLSSAEPPADVHAMARGPLAAGGDPSTADIVVGCLAEAGYEIPDGAAVLDFGASSGRVVRALQAWRPDVRWMGCDPNSGAMAWAHEHLPGIRFFESPGRPPLPLDDGELDAAFAISIWSHFDAEPARLWLAEMHRVVKPGGMLLITTHGWDTLAQLVRRDLMTPGSADTAAASMLALGHQFFDIFGDEGDWGVRDPGWGNMFLTLDWLAAEVTGQWSVRLFRPGRLDHNQDVIVLERRP